MTLDEKDLDAITDKVAEKLKEEKEAQEAVLVSLRDIEKMCGYGFNSSVVRNWAKDPTFPSPCPKSAVRKWFKDEVVGWLKSDREEQTAQAVLETRMPWEA